MGKDAIILLNQTISKNENPNRKQCYKSRKFEQNDRNNSTLSKQQYFGYFCAKLDKFLKKERNKKVPHS
jgi:hypothetical protein